MTKKEASQSILAGKYQKQADELSAEISRLEAVSPDTAYREGFNLSALRRAEGAAKEDKVFLGGYARSILIIGISALGPEKAEKFIAACGGWKSHANLALKLLDGEYGEIRKNKTGTCWIIDLTSPRREVMFTWTCGPHEIRLAGPRLNTTNGGAHWCGLTSASVVSGTEEKNPYSVEFLRKATACWKEHGMTPQQLAEAESRRQKAANERAMTVLCAAKDACLKDEQPWCYGGYGPQYGSEYRAIAEEIAGSEGPIPTDLADQIRIRLAKKRLAEEEARIMAELEAEQALIVKKKTEETKRLAALETACQNTGISPAAWQAMTPKQQGLALHRARLAGKNIG